MKTHVCKYADGQGVTAEEALKQGMEAKSKDSSRWAASEKDFAQREAAGQDCGSSRSQCVTQGAEVYAKA